MTSDEPTGAAMPGTVVTTSPEVELRPTVVTVSQTTDVIQNAVDREPTARRLPTLPGYEVLGELGRGGMGVVYKAKHIQLGRLTAIKMLLGGQYANPVALIRFQLEAESVARIQHPYIVQLYEFGQHDQQPYFALEYIDGGNLADKLHAEGPFAPRVAAEMVGKLAQAVAAAHAKGIVHRDLKPANVLLDSQGEPKITDFGLAKVEHSEVTASGAVMGTPSYMSPEQASGRTQEVGTGTDVYALGVILFELLTGKPPFRGDSVMETLTMVVADEPPRPRSLVSGVPRDLETICLKCLTKDIAKRYGTAAEVHADLQAFLAGLPIAARPVGAVERAVKWGKRNPGWAVAVVTAVLIVVGIGVAVNVVSSQRDADHAAAEKKRQADLRSTRADALMRALTEAEAIAVPRILEELKEYRDLIQPRLQELATEPITTKAGLHARLALLSENRKLAGPVADYLTVCKNNELLTIRQLLKPHAAAVAAKMWGVLSDAEDPEPRIRAACALAGWFPTDSRWPILAPVVADLLVQENPLLADDWADALEPLRDYLVPALVKKYPQSRKRILSGKLNESDLVAEASSFDLTAQLLARYTADRPAELAELAMMADVRHHANFIDAIKHHPAEIAPRLKAELDKAPPDVEPEVGRLAKRQASAAAVLVLLNEPASVWPLFQFPANGDPTSRSYLLRRLAAVNANPDVLMQRFAVEPDVSAKRALLIALGDYPPHRIDTQRRERFVVHLLKLYRTHPDAGLHSAIAWLLGESWGHAKDIAGRDAEWTAQTRTLAVMKQVLTRRLPITLPDTSASPTRDWSVTGEGQTFAIVRGPVEFQIGSPVGEVGRMTEEVAHRKRIERTFAIGTREVSTAEFLRFRPKHSWIRQYAEEPEMPALSVSWYDAAAYCNWLSEREGIAEDQWCYSPNSKGEYADGMQIHPDHLKRTGYRLPTEVEWEFACRAGAKTSRFYGHGEELLSRYGWYIRYSDEHSWPNGRLRPNDLGLFDTLGNAAEWCVNPALQYEVNRMDDSFPVKYLTVTEQNSRMIRGGTFYSQPADLRSALRNFYRPGLRNFANGFRVARTLSP